jgi:diguanylate cyclase (GGDEF)-like protein/PAS domain S-box-containing protein
MGQFFIVFLISFVIRGNSGIYLTIFSILINIAISFGQKAGIIPIAAQASIVQTQTYWFTQSIFILMVGIVGVIANRRLESAIAEAQKNVQRFQTIFEQTDESIIITSPNFIIQDANPPACFLLQEPLENLVNHSLLDHVPMSLHPDLQDIIQDVFSKKEITGIEFETQSKDETPQFLQLSVKLISLEKDKPDHIMVILRDITIQKSSQKQVQKIAFQDHLTRLENRFSFNYKINSSIAKLKRDGGKLALIFIDIDGFKKANDRYGHLIGDKLLYEFAYRLRKATREGDFLARIGGDEFVLIIENLNSKEDLDNTIQRIELAVNAPYTFQEITIQITASIGVSHYPEDGTDADALLKKADQDMFRAKPHSRGRLL